MARRESPLDPSEGPLQTFAHDLRALRQKRGLTYRELAEKAGYSRTTLSDAASGRSLPTLDVVRAFVHVCGADQAEWSRRWREVSAAQSAERARDEPGEPVADPHLRELLTAVRQYWIDAELRHALDSTGRLPIRLLEHTDPPRPVPETTTILELFQRSAQLLVLGDPGVGKSLLLLELTRQLADAWVADPTQPVPVVVPLSSWAQRRGGLDAWLVEELFRLYSVDRNLGRRWVRTRRVLPLLDGLDEVATAHREACVAAINDYRYRRGAVYPLAVSCRTEVYRSLAIPLRPRRIVEVCRLTTEDVRRQLRTAGPELAGVRAAVDGDPRLAELATTPLFLAMISYAYRGCAAVPGTPLAFFHDYVLRRLRNDFPAKPELAQRTGADQERQVLHWLGWLARAMRERNETVFQPDLMQPDLLPGPAGRWLRPPRFAVLIGLLTAALFGTITGLIIDTISTVPGSGVTAGLLEGSVVGLACAAQCRRPDIEPARRPRPTFATLVRSLVRGLGWGLVGAALGALAGLWFGTMNAGGILGTPLGLLAVGLCGWFLGGAIGGATLGALSGLALGAVSGLRAEPDVRPARPGAGMRDTRRLALTVGASTAVLGTIAYGLHFGLALGTIVALRIGGAAYLRHQALRWLLVRRGAIPRHLLGFLHDAHIAVLLTEVGGGYKFTHPLLHDYVAGLEPAPGR